MDARRLSTDKKSLEYQFTILEQLEVKGGNNNRRKNKRSGTLDAYRRGPERILRLAITARLAIAAKRG